MNPDGVPRLLGIVSDVSFLHTQGFSDFSSILLNITFSVKGPNLEQTFDLATPNLYPQKPRLCITNLLERMHTLKLLRYLVEVCIL